VSVDPRFRYGGIVLVRATTDPGDLEVPHDLDLSDEAAVLDEGAAWLAKTWSRPEIREALDLASQVLVAQLDRLVDGSTLVTAKEVRRAVVSVASYLLRWQRRATPFGLFAAVGSAAVGPATAAVGDRHQAVARADGEWLTAVVDQLERHPDLRTRLLVVADNTAIVRDGRLITARRADLDGGGSVPLREASVRCTRPVQAALALAATPIRFDALTAALADRFPTATAAQVRAVLDDLVDQRFLVTNLRPPMSAPDGLAHVLDALTAAGAHDLPDVAAVLRQLGAVRDLLAEHNATGDPARAAGLRASAAGRMTALAPGHRPTLAVDTRLHADIRVPEEVLAEAALAATVLLRVATKPFGSAAWLDYHARFRARYGSGALVPVRDLVADSGLGYPTGYLGAPRAHPAWRTLTERDAAVLALVQRAALDHRDEIALTDADLAALTVGEPAEVVPPARIELGMAVHAASADAVDRGEFQLRITAAPAVPTSMAGRFAGLLDDSGRDRLAASYQSDGDAVAVQLSFPPRRPHDDNVTRVPPLLPDVLALAEHPTGDPISVDDLAVTADGDQMYLVQISTGRRVVPYIPHALDTTVQSPPLARFLAEVADARTAVFGPFDVGAARTLPYLPRFRYRRTVLAAARWILTVDDLPAQDGTRWDDELAGWRRRWRVPARVVACHGELRLPLNLDHRLDRALLRTRLTQARRLEVQEDTEPSQQGWIGRPAELLIPMTPTSPPRRAVPPLASPATLHLPGNSEVVHARLTGNPARFDDIIAAHLPRLAAVLEEVAGGVERWWIRRHRDLIRLDAEQSLSLVLRLTHPGQYAAVAAQLSTFAADLATRGLPGQLSFVPHQHQPGRYGHGPAVAAAERVFAADTACAIAQITAADRGGVPAQAWAVASMVRITAAFAPDQPSGCRALVDCLAQQSGKLDRAVRDHTLRLTDAATGRSDPASLAADGDQVAAVWRMRDWALACYFHTVRVQRDPAGILPTLLHDHHVRALGVDPTFEKVTTRLARAAALRHLALAGSR
jgi:thiopeptide-type bacteriocin biosynthesis protein